MRAPALRADMERRLLVNYRVDPELLASLLPAPFRPILVGGYGVAGICLIRLAGIRPAGVPAGAGLTSENAAHRVAVCWDSKDGPVTGVYVPRRDTSSRLAALAGGRLFPGWQHLARFRAEEHDGWFRVQADSRDGVVHILVAGHLTDDLPPGSIFADLDSASRFFRCAPVGYAATPAEGRFDGVELETAGWGLRPLYLEELSSSFFDDPARFPPGTAAADSAFLMGGLSTTWRPLPELRATQATIQ
ncbi:MAG TPA: DUF2071 domain-containing protein [Streptosporangiaceae bacterium]|nr:DUF2071 domain-containing protein [Streptosporangiaceae bacterium]